MNTKKPWWFPTVQGFLAASIVIMMFTAIVLLVLLAKSGTMADATVFAVITTLLGVLASSFKDVYGYSFGSSASSKDKDDTISSMVMKQPLPINVPTNGAPITTENTTVKSENTTIETEKK